MFLFPFHPQTGITVMHAAALGGNVDIVKLLLTHGVYLHTTTVVNTPTDNIMWDMTCVYNIYLMLFALIWPVELWSKPLLLFMYNTSGSPVYILLCHSRGTTYSQCYLLRMG